MMKNLVEDIVARHERQLTARAALDGELETIRKYIDHFLPSFTAIKVPYDDLLQRYSDTPQLAADNWVGAIHRALTPAGLDWVQLEPEDPALFNDWGERERISQAEKAVQDGLDRSNFQAAIQYFWRLFGNAGTAFLLLDDWKNRGEYFFSSFSSVGVSFFDNHVGQVDTIGREVEMSAKQIYQSAIQRGWTIPAKVQEALDGNKSDTEFNLLHYIGPGNDVLPIRNSGQKFVSIYILKETKEVLNANGGRFEGYEEFPVVVGRQVRVSTDNMGRSRAFSIVRDVLMLNRIVHCWESGIEIGILGFYKDRVDNLQYKSGDPEHIKGGDRLYLTDPNVFQEAHAPVNYGLAFEEIASRENHIKEHFYWSQINMRKEKYNMTTMELMQAQAQLADLLAYQLTSVPTDIMTPLIERCLAIKMRGGKIAWPKRAMMEMAA